MDDGETMDGRRGWNRISTTTVLTLLVHFASTMYIYIPMCVRFQMCILYVKCALSHCEIDCDFCTILTFFVEIISIVLLISMIDLFM